jgi:hypothetical protein
MNAWFHYRWWFLSYLEKKINRCLTDQSHYHINGGIQRITMMDECRPLLHASVTMKLGTISQNTTNTFMFYYLYICNMKLCSTLFPSFQKLSRKGWGPDLFKSAENLICLSLVQR